MLKIFVVKVFYVMGKALSGQLSCPCDKSCLKICSENFVICCLACPYKCIGRAIALSLALALHWRGQNIKVLN